MRRNPRKLRLSRETVRHLGVGAAENLRWVRGGIGKPEFTQEQTPSEYPCNTQLQCTNGCVSDLCVTAPCGSADGGC